MTWPNIQHPIYMYDCCGWYSCPKNLWRAFGDGLIGNDEKVASKKHTQFETRVKNHTLFETKIDTLFMTKAAEKPYPL